MGRYVLSHPEKVHDRLYKDAAQRRTNLEEDRKSAAMEWNLTNARPESPKTPRNRIPTTYTQLVRPYKEKPKAPKFSRSVSARDRLDTTTVTPSSKKGPRSSSPVLKPREELQQQRSSKKASTGRT